MENIFIKGNCIEECCMMYRLRKFANPPTFLSPWGLNIEDFYRRIPSSGQTNIIFL